MIPILYNHSEKDFTSQGVCRLADAVDCIVTEERNGIYECELKYPIDGIYFEEIFEGRLIGATHDDNGDIQPFEIYKHSAPIDGIVTFYAHHLSYRLRNHILIPFHASSCAEAVSMLKAKSMNNCPFDFFTDVGTLGNFDVEYPVSIKSRLAGDGDSLLNLYGPGEFKYDKWNVSFLEHRGVDHGVEIRYGKNLTDITREYDESEVYTAVVPYWFKEDSEGNKTLVTLDEYGVIVSESDAVQHVFWTNENDEIIRDEQGHPIEFASASMIYATLDLTSEFDEAPTQAQLATRAKQLFEAAQPWLPEDNIKISFVALWQTPEYEDYAPLEKVSLCDIVHVIHTRIGVMVDAEVIKTVYNVLLDRYNEIELGSPQASYADEIASDTQAALEEIQRQIRRSVTADYVNEQIGAATDKITGGLGGYIKVTLNADGEPQEILVMDQPSTTTARKVIRINQNGIGFSTTGYQGPFNSAWLIDGTFDAQVINVVNLAATVIRTGFLTDAKGYNYWNLETGEFRLSSTATLGAFGETDYTASRDYAVGEMIEVKTASDTLIYEVTKVIPKDSAIIPGNNVKPATAHTLLDYARKAEVVSEVDVEYASHTSSITPPPEDSPLWQTTSPAWELGKYIWQRTKMIDGNSAVNYSDPVCIQGAQGTNSAIVYLYKRSSTAATIDWTKKLTYDFATNKLTSLPSGWVDDLTNLPDNEDPIYMTAATASSRTDTDEIPYTEWATPALMAQNGADAPKTAVVVLYKRSNAVPAKPTAELTYTFNTAKLTPADSLAGWSQSVPTADGNPCYSIQAVAISDGDTDKIPASEWTDVVEVFSNGLDAYNNAVVYLYKRSATTPSKPNVTTTYTFSDQSLSPVPSGWSRAYIGGSDPLYVTAASASSTESSVEIEANAWSDPVILTRDGAPGVDGKNTATIRLYKRASSSPSIDWSNDLTYDFSTNHLTSVPTGWSESVPEGDEDLYATAATASAATQTDTISVNEWAPPICITKNGLSWSTAAVFLYARADASTDLTKPQQTLDYAFSTGILSYNGQTGPAVLGGWSQEIPETNGKPCFVIQATAVSDDGQTDAIAPSEWSNIAKLVSDGENGNPGANGRNTVVIYLYKRSATAPSINWTKSLTYTFATNTLSEIPTGWSRDIPSGTDPLYVTAATATSTEATDTISYKEWTTPILMAQNGQAGNNGRNTAVLYLYKRASSAPSIDWSNTLTYTFATNTLSPIPSGWARAIPSGDDPLYVTAATASSTEATDTIDAGEWSAPVIMAQNGQNGTNGNPGLNSATVFLYARAASASALTKPTTALTYTFESGVLANVPSPWSQQMPASDGNPCFVIQATAVNTTETASIPANKWSAITLFLNDGEDGRSILSVTEYYARSKVNTTAPSSWDTDVPTLTATWKYLWNYELITYSTMDSEDPTKHETQETAKRVIGVYGNTGAAGKGISSIVNHYLATASGSGVTKSTSGWTDAVQTMTATKKYLWNYETITYSDSDTDESDPTIIGVYGNTGAAGKGISSVQEQYYLSNSDSQISGGSWQTTQPAWTKDHYIWTRSKITWSDKSTSYTTAICANAINGANEAVERLDDSLTQDEVFKRLTNGFNTEGVFLENGRLFLNSTGIATGFIHDQTSLSNQTINFYNEKSNLVSRGYPANSYVYTGKYGTYRTTKSVYTYEWINSVDTQKIERIGTVFTESSMVATRNYISSNYILVGTNLYQATTTIPAGTTLTTSGSKNCNLLGTCYTENGDTQEHPPYYASRAYSTNTYIAYRTNLYRTLVSIASGELMHPGKNAEALVLGNLYNNYWNLNTGQFVTKRGQIAGFNIGESTYNGSSWSSLFYMSAMRDNVYNWGYPYSAANTPIQGVGLRGSSDSVNLGFNVISQGPMYINNAITNYAGRIRLSAGMLYFDLGLSPNSVNSGWTTAAYINPWSGSGGTGININGNLAVTGNLACTGTKPRIVDTGDYGWRYLYAYENPTPMFGDIGEGEIGEDGLCYVWLEPIFAQTIENGQYQVFLQKYGDGKCFIKTRASGYFIVQGTPGLTFGWEIKAKQKGYGMTRLQNEAKNFGIIQPTMPENQDYFANVSNDYLQNLREGRISE